MGDNVEDTGVFKVSIAKAFEKFEKKMEALETKRDEQHNTLIGEIKMMSTDVNKLSFKVQDVQNQVNIIKLHTEDNMAHCKADPGNPGSCAAVELITGHISTDADREKENKQVSLKKAGLVIAAFGLFLAVGTAMFKIIGLIIDWVKGLPVGP